jgi:hypothetical protein
MNLYALDIPDNSAELPGWLEAHVMGPDLAALVAELSAVHGPATPATETVREVLGEQLGAVLAGGLGKLPPGTLRQLLQRPRLLLELQQLVATAGGAYWDQIGRRTPELRSRIDRGQRRLQAFLATEEPEHRQVLSLSTRSAWFRRPWVVSLATAASVLVGVGVYQHNRPPNVVEVVKAPTGWGWNKPEALAENVPADAYLNQLADAAADWFKQRPEQPAAVAKRIAEFRQGCSMLILANHAPLSAEDRQWLVERCQLWARKLTNHLVAIEVGLDPLEVRAQADDTVNQLIAALRKRAQG